MAKKGWEVSEIFKKKLKHCQLFVFIIFWHVLNLIQIRLEIPLFFFPKDIF